MKKIIFLVLSFSILISFTPMISQEEILEIRCLNEDGSIELDFEFITGVREFDESRKLVELSIDVDIENEKTLEPFDSNLRRYPYLGTTVIPETQDPENENFQVKNFKVTETRISPIPNFPINMWPFETYTIPMFLEFDSDVKLCYSHSEEMSSDIHSYKAGFFHENPNWDVSINVKEITLTELEELIPGIKPKFTEPTIFQFDTIIFHTDGYKNKNSFYFIVALVPIMLIIAHGLFFKFDDLQVHIAFFVGVAILLLTSLFAIRPSTPIDLTLLETISLSSISVYAVGFFIFLLKRRKKMFSKTLNS